MQLSKQQKKCIQSFKLKVWTSEIKLLALKNVGATKEKPTFNKKWDAYAKSVTLQNGAISQHKLSPGINPWKIIYHDLQPPFALF